MLDFRIESFLAVCRHMSYTKASHELNLTQPAISQHIHWLEQQYGTPLFHYANKRLSLTTAGQLLLTAATTIQHDEIQLKRLMLQTLRRSHDLRFGATPTVGSYMIPTPLAKYHTLYPKANISVRISNTKELCSALDKGEIDFAIVEGYVHKKEYDSLLYRKEPYLAVCSKDYPLEKEPKRLEDLLSHTLLLRETGSGNREFVLRSLTRSNLQLSDFSSLIEVSDMNVVKQLLLEGIGIAFFYKAAVEHDIDQKHLRILHLEDLQEYNDINFIWRKDSLFSSMYQQLFAKLQ